MAKFELFRRDSGEIMAFIVFVFVVLGGYVFKLSFELIKMGVKGEFTILSKFSGYELFITSISPGIFLALAMVWVLVYGLPRVLHPKN